MRLRLFYAVVFAVLFPLVGQPAESSNKSLIFQNLRNLLSSFPVDNPAVAAESEKEGPKGLAVGDLNGDGIKDLVAGNNDGSIAVLFGAPSSSFEAVRHLAAGSARGLRDIIAANVNEDSRPEIIAAHPYDGRIYIFSISGDASSRSFASPVVLTTWQGARSVIAGDFNGDGKTDLVVAGPGQGGSVREYRGNGNGTFLALPPITAIPVLPYDGDFAKPVFAMHVWRKAGETRDRLVVSYVGSGAVWFLQSPGGGLPMAVTGAVQLTGNESVYDLATAYLSPESRSSGEPDLVTVSTYSNEILIRQYSATSYPSTPQLRLTVPGGPRALSVSDLNGDGWPDLLVPARDANTLSVYINRAGNLSLTSQTATGNSPRDVVSADFDGNGLPDAAVINRQSADVTVHRIDPATGSFLQNVRIQRVPGNAIAPSIRDIDGDGRCDLLYLTPLTGEACIQRLDSSFLWMPAKRYSMGVQPQTLSTPDINGDGLPDLLSTSSVASDPGSNLRCRLQLPDHTFGPLLTFGTTTVLSGGSFAELARDFNGDGQIDVVVLRQNGSLEFFQGTSAGLVHRRTELFLSPCRAIMAVDADQDGDLDLIGVGAYGELAVIENNGQWFTGEAYRKRTYSGSSDLTGAYAFSTDDIDGDGDPDLVVLAQDSVSRWKGRMGVTFEFQGTTPVEPARDATGLDFDGDGIMDVFTLSTKNTKVSYYKGEVGKDWWTALSQGYRVPSTNGLASGDLDGDGQPDLVGAGEYLWVALSRVLTPSLAPSAQSAPDPEIPGVVINEVLSSTKDYWASGSSEPVDCLEIFNGTGASVELGGWRLRRISVTGIPFADFIFPAYTLQDKQVKVVYCTGQALPWTAPFKLPSGGCTLQLINADGEQVDSVSYPAMQEDVSYARLFDGARTFTEFYPSIGNSNFNPITESPKVTFKGLDYTLLRDGRWRFRANAWSKAGIFTVIVSWRQMTTASNARQGTIALYDDGMHGDGESFDALFAGDWENPLPPGTPIEFYLTGTDLRWEKSTEPGEPEFTTSGGIVHNYTLAVPATATGWEISEVVSNNLSGLQDETGARSDWVEVRYTGNTSTPVNRLYLSDSLFGFKTTKLYDVARLGTVALPGYASLVFLDGTAEDPAKPAHAPFKVNSDGDSLYLLRIQESGATEFVDTVKVPALASDVAYARLGPGGPFVETTPTPKAPNVPVGGRIDLLPSEGGRVNCWFTFGGSGVVEASDDLVNWTAVSPWVPPSAIEHVYSEPVHSPRRFFRVR